MGDNSMANNTTAKGKGASRTSDGGERPQNSPRVMSAEERYQRIANIAYGLYQQRGEVHGHDVDDWLTAERLVDEDGPQSSLSATAPVEEP
jgi:hypothetical protein